MTYGEKYKTLKERGDAFIEFCNSHHSCSDCAISNIKKPKDPCAFIWLALEADEDKPLPCPFCGGEAKLVVNHPIKTKGAYVQCTRCWAYVTGFNTKYDAIAAWNRRVK